MLSIHRGFAPLPVCVLCGLDHQLVPFPRGNFPPGKLNFRPGKEWGIGFQNKFLTPPPRGETPGFMVTPTAIMFNCKEREPQCIPYFGRLKAKAEDAPGRTKDTLRGTARGKTSKHPANGHLYGTFSNHPSRSHESLCITNTSVSQSISCAYRSRNAGLTCLS